MKPVAANKALFIKLGESGRWESGCIGDGTLRFGYQEIPHSVCAAGDWAEVEHMARGFSKDRGSATRHEPGAAVLRGGRKNPVGHLRPPVLVLFRP